MNMTQMTLSESLNNQDVQLAIFGLDNEAKSADVANALQIARQEFTDRGRNQEGFPWILITALGNQAANSFQLLRNAAINKLLGGYQSMAAELVCASSIHMMSIGVGTDYSTTETDALASDPSKDKFTYLNYDNLLSSSKLLQTKICDAARNYNPVVDKDDSANILGDCQANMDLVIMLDASISIPSTTFVTMKLFLNEFASRLDIGQNKIRLGIVSFSNIVHENTVFPLSSSNDLLTVQSSGIFLQQPGNMAGTNTAEALRRTNTMFTE
ncbi:CO6A4-like protein, partial [Mya arenaria]